MNHWSWDGLHQRNIEELEHRIDGIRSQIKSIEDTFDKLDKNLLGNEDELEELEKDLEYLRGYAFEDAKADASYEQWKSSRNDRGSCRYSCEVKAISGF